MTVPSRKTPFDGRVSRAIAFAVFVLSAGVLVYVHRDDIWRKAPAVPAQDTAFARCIGAAHASIGKMQKEGLIGKAQSDGFLQRAEARCKAQLGGGSAMPLPPSGR